MKLVLDMLYLSFQAQTNSIPGWLRASELFLICSEDQGHSETGSFCSGVRVTEPKAASQAALRMEDFTRVLQLLRSTASGPHHQSHSYRSSTCLRSVGKWAKGTTSPQDTSVIPCRLPGSSNQTVVVKLCVFWANLEVLGCAIVLSTL